METLGWIALWVIVAAVGPLLIAYISTAVIFPEDDD